MRTQGHSGSFLCLGRATEVTDCPYTEGNIMTYVNIKTGEEVNKHLYSKGSQYPPLPLTSKFLILSFSTHMLSPSPSSSARPRQRKLQVSLRSHLWGFANVLPSALKRAFPQFPAPFQSPAAWGTDFLGREFISGWKRGSPSLWSFYSLPQKILTKEVFEAGNYPFIKST